MPWVHLSDVSYGSSADVDIDALPIIPAFRVYNSAIRQSQQKFSSLIFDVDEVIDQKFNFSMYLWALPSMNSERRLRHSAVDA